MADDRDTSGAPEPADHPGRPRRRDELDPELLRLPRTSARIGPVLAASVIVFCIYMMVHMRHDLAFSRQGDEPRRLDARALLAADAPGDDAFLALEATPDRAFVARVGTTEADHGWRASPILGTDDRVWLLLSGNVWATELAYDELYVGRLRSLDAVPFGDDLRSYVAERGPTARFVTGAALREALASGAGAVATPAGDRLPLGPATPVALQIVSGERSLVKAGLTDDRRDEAAWREALAAAGLEVRGPGQTAPDDPATLIFEVAGPADAAERALTEARLLAAWAEPAIEERTTSAGELRTTPAGFAVAGATVPYAEVEWATVSAARAIPSGAVILIAGDRPDAYWYMLPLYAIMALFTALMAWALVRSLRRTPPAEAPAEADQGAPTAAAPSSP